MHPVEIAVMIGKRGRNIGLREAQSYVAGYSQYLEVKW
jgi:2-keto-4-pentenoate hydratase/2-oxohepta-3-ene-1,7-dioic acid hydratase in catechol pathway